jgi:4'-phosphopantetheinyl transferase EntD
MIEELVPRVVATAEAFEDRPAMLFPEECEAVGRAVESRRREFATARACARVALGRLGLNPAPIARGPGGAPCWPDGIVGSVTHCAGYRAAAVAREQRVVAIGVDAEPNEPLPDGVLGVVAAPRERAALEALSGRRASVAWDRLLFSAKEAVYKAWFPLTQRWLDFGDVLVALDADQRTFGVRVRVAAPSHVPAFSGRWLVRHGLIVTAIALPRDRAAGDVPAPRP